MLNVRHVLGCRGGSLFARVYSRVREYPHHLPTSIPQYAG